MLCMDLSPVDIVSVSRGNLGFPLTHRPCGATYSVSSYFQGELRDFSDSLSIGPCVTRSGGSNMFGSYVFSSRAASLS